MTAEVPPPGTWRIDPSRSTIRFATRHMFGFGPVSGTFAFQSGELVVGDPPTASSVRAAADAASFTTGTPSRDRKVRSQTFLDATRYPEITFHADRVRATDDGWMLTGTITVKDAKAAVEFHVSEARMTEDGLAVRASAIVDRYALGVTAMKGLAARRLKLNVAVHAHKTSTEETTAKHQQQSQREENPMATKVAVIYYSSTGTIYQLAKSVVEGAEKAGAEVRLRKVHELAPQAAIDSNPAWAAHAAEAANVTEASADDVLWADAVIFGSPTRFGNIASQLKQFLDTLGGPWQQGQLADKVYSGFTASSTTNGGQESTLLALYNTIHHFGGIVAAPGYTDAIKFVEGNPYGTSHVSGQGTIPIPDTTLQAAAFQGGRTARIASALKAGGLR